MSNRTKAQKTLSKIASRKNERVQQSVHENMKLYDSDFAKNNPGEPKNFVARDAFMKLCEERARTTIV